MSNGAGPNRYNSTPRKVFDKYIDRMAVRRTRDLEDHRADMKALIRRLDNLETQLTLATEDYDELRQHVATHCRRISSPEEE